MSSKKNVFGVIFIIALSYYWMNYVKKGPIYASKKVLSDKTVLITGKWFN